MPINHDPYSQKENKRNMISIKLYELNEVRTLAIDLNNKKDRSKLKHILVHERYRMRKRDIRKYEDFLNNS